MIKQHLTEFETELTREKAEPSIPSSTAPSEQMEVAAVSPHLDTDEERCEQYDRLEQFIRQIPVAIKTVHDGWSSSIGNYATTRNEYFADFNGAKKTDEMAHSNITTAQSGLTNLTTALNNQTELEAIAEELDNVSTSPATLTQAEKDEFMRNTTTGGSDEVVFQNIETDLNKWNKTAKDKLVQQNVVALNAIISSFADPIMAETGLELSVYLTQLLDGLAALYETVQTSDLRYANARIIVDSVGTIKEKLLSLGTKTLFEANTIAKSLVIEIDEINDIKVFCP
eukprot:m.103050 g.103050  ORF g.103050 m.103050 type:complete len:284 (+) comp37188_c0_seq1:381-1232(+)